MHGNKKQRTANSSTEPKKSTCKSALISAEFGVYNWKFPIRTQNHRNFCIIRTRNVENPIEKYGSSVIFTICIWMETLPTRSHAFRSRHQTSHVFHTIYSMFISKFISNDPIYQTILWLTRCASSSIASPHWICCWKWAFSAVYRHTKECDNIGGTIQKHLDIPCQSTNQGQLSKVSCYFARGYMLWVWYLQNTVFL